jgi:23S rRNA (cytidine1920-2'-O)/16S rRNA (cytidine1409-2'-O)-methyltransferase
MAVPSNRVPKCRADVLVVERQLCQTRAQAQRLILAGQVRTGPDRVVTKPGQLLAADTQLILDQPFPYVSRGALKLIAVLDAVPASIDGAVALDVGASTGGFTDVLLQRGARRVYAVDVGYGQIHARLRADPRVVCLERVNARYLTAERIPDPVDVLTVDVSFISLRQVLPACRPLLRRDAWCFLLVKPQFEAGRKQVGRGGVVRDPAVREQCVTAVCQFAETHLGLTLVTVTPSPILGPAGNQEFMVALRASGGT